MSARTKAAQADEQFRAALTLVQAGETSRAMRLLERALTFDARHKGVRNALGVLRLETGDATGAIALLKPLARDVPDAAGIQLNLGNALVAAGQAGEAIAPLKRATTLDPNSALVWYGYARALQTVGRVADAEPAYRRVMQLAPAHVETRANLAAVLNFLDRYSESEVEAREALRLVPSHAGAHVNLAVSLLAQHRWAEGWAEYEWRQQTTLLDGQRRVWEMPRWEGEDVAGRTILVHAEQGFGDTLQFVRYLPLLRGQGARVVLQVPPSLEALLRHAQVADQILCNGDTLPAHDLQVPLTGLPHRLRCASDAEVHVQSAPYLTPLPTHGNPLGASQSGNALRVGLVWAGSGTHVNDMHRSCGLSALLPLLHIDGVEWVSLQSGPRSADLARTLAAAQTTLPVGVSVIDAAPLLTDFADTAAVIASLDVVVTVDSAVAHLAGAMGVPCWLLLPRVGLDWRWVQASGADVGAVGTPWYSSVQLVRQTTAADWSAPVAEISRALTELVAERAALVAS